MLLKSLLFNVISSLSASYHISSHYTENPIRLVDKDDALVAATVEELGPGWRIVPTNTVCKDSTSCKRVKKEDCLTPHTKKGKENMIKCRQKCKKFLIEEGNHIPEDVSAVGGVDDILQDRFGFKLNICSEAEGFDEVQRKNVVIFQNLNDVVIPYIPKFTETGVDKTKIPSELFSFLVEKIKNGDKTNKWAVETLTQPGVINDRMMVEKVGMDDSRKMIHLNRTLMLTLDSDDYKRVVYELWPLAEAWSGVELDMTAVYGIRRYLNNSALISHIDK